MDDFNCTNFLIDIVMGWSTKDASYCYFRKAVFKQLLSESLTDKFRQHLRQLASELQFCSFSADRRLSEVFSTKRVGHCSCHTAV